ncbi:Serine incorporator 1 [Larimichthys crocea]|uniref:Uncharacterized protein n=1 Tax=Larimichthys crocea TaxID=215358 RepID=A0ACD3RID1_LARCR|nr:Serine incorporator 1 [Larimichthys crocea]
MSGTFRVSGIEEGFVDRRQQQQQKAESQSGVLPVEQNSRHRWTRGIADYSALIAAEHFTVSRSFPAAATGGRTVKPLARSPEDTRREGGTFKDVVSLLLCRLEEDEGVKKKFYSQASAFDVFMKVRHKQMEPSLPPKCFELAASCLCGSAPCLLSACCPSTYNSTMSRLAFSFLMLLGTLVSVIMILPGMEQHLKNIPGFCVGGSGIPGITHNLVNCDVIVGYKSVYRMCFAMACFFFFFSVIMIRVRSSKDPRAYLQNGFWFFKFLMLVGITVGAFFIPDGTFNTVWYYFGVVGSFIFIIIQLILLVDFAHSWNQSWLVRAEEGNTKCWFAALLSITIINFALAFTAIVLFYVFYTKPDDCTEHKVFISLNFIFCIIVSIVAILPKVQEAQPSSGLLQASLISLYTMYVTWSAMYQQPQPAV